MFPSSPALLSITGRSLDDDWKARHARKGHSIGKYQFSVFRSTRISGLIAGRGTLPLRDVISHGVVLGLLFLERLEITGRR